MELDCFRYWRSGGGTCVCGASPRSEGGEKRHGHRGLFFNEIVEGLWPRTGEDPAPDDFQFSSAMVWYPSHRPILPWRKHGILFPHRYEYFVAFWLGPRCSSTSEILPAMLAPPPNLPPPSNIRLNHALINWTNWITFLIKGVMREWCSPAVKVKNGIGMSQRQYVYRRNVLVPIRISGIWHTKMVRQQFWLSFVWHLWWNCVDTLLYQSDFLQRATNFSSHSFDVQSKKMINNKQNAQVQNLYAESTSSLRKHRAVKDALSTLWGAIIKLDSRRAWKILWAAKHIHSTLHWKDLLSEMSTQYFIRGVLVWMMAGLWRACKPSCRNWDTKVVRLMYWRSIARWVGSACVDFPRNHFVLYINTYFLSFLGMWMVNSSSYFWCHHRR